MDKALFKYIEKELYDYEDTLKLIEDLEYDIRCDSGINYETERTGQTYRISQPTEDKAINLITNKQLTRAVSTIEAIEKAKRRMGDTERQILDLKYIQQIHFKRIYAVLVPMSEKTFYNYRNRIIKFVADELGYITK